MKKLLLFLIFITGNLLYAQVGIGTDLPNPSSQLEIKSSNRGVLIPQVSLTGIDDQTTITAGNLESLLIYNTSNNATVTPGYYYWFQNSWHRFLTEADLPDFRVFWNPDNNQFSYVDENGDVQIINISDLETLTYLGLNADGHTLEYTDEDGVISSINLETVIKNFETLTAIVNNGDGTFTYTDEQGNDTVIDMANVETLTYLALNTDGKTLEYTDEDGVVTSIDLETVVKNFETLTVIINNGDGTFTYTDEQGNDTVIDMANVENLTYLALNTDGKTLEYTDENGVMTSINLETVIKNFETITTLVNNADGTFTYTNEAGDTTIIDVSNLETLTTISLNPDNINIDYTDEVGVVTQLNLTALVKNLETITTLVDNADGTFTYTNEAGAITTIDASNIETLTFFALNADGKTLDYTDENGSVSSVNLGAVIKNFETLTSIVANADGTFTYTDEAGLDTIINIEDLETLTTIALNADNIHIDYTDEAGLVTQLNLTALVKNLETITTLVDNADGTFTYTNEAGTTTTIDVSHLDTLTFLALNTDGKTLEYTDENGALTSIDLDTIIKNLETITTLVANADGTFTYTNEAGATTDIDVSSIETLTTLVLNADGKTLEYKDEDGVITYIELDTIIQANQKTITLVDGENTTVTSDAVGDNTEYKVNVATATDTNLGVVKQATVNPSVLIDVDGELSVDLSNLNAIKEVSANYALDIDDAIILGNASAANVTITLPTADASNKGKKFTIKKQDANEDNYVTVTGNIDGLTQLYTALPYSGWDLVSDGNQWRIVNKF